MPGDILFCHCIHLTHANRPLSRSVLELHGACSEMRSSKYQVILNDDDYDDDGDYDDNDDDTDGGGGGER